MREADALEALLDGRGPSERSCANLRQFRDEVGDARSSEFRRSERSAPTPTSPAAIGLGGKDLYRQARAIWHGRRTGDPRARSGLSASSTPGRRPIHAAYKDLRRRDRFTAGFRPTPYDVWAFRHDRAFGIPHPGSIPPAIVAHALHYLHAPGALVVDPMAGGGTTLDVCESMGRRCLAYDLHPYVQRSKQHDVREGFPPEAQRMRPDLLRSALSHDARAALRRRRRRRRPARRLDRLPRAARPRRPRRRSAPADTSPCSWPTRPRRTCPPAMAISITPSLATTPWSPPASCPSGGSVARWTAPTCRSTSSRARAEGRMLGQVRDLLVDA